MKKILLLYYIVLPISVNIAQNHPLFPKDHYDILVNYLSNEEIVVKISIPVYLNTTANKIIEYRWYDTNEIFGETVRTSEKPRKTEQGTYEYGRLTMYYKESYFYKFEWENNGKIKRITKYNESGSGCGSYSPRHYSWYNANTIIRLGSKISIYNKEPFMLTSYEEYKTGGFMVNGYTIKDSWIVNITYWGDKNGRIEKDEWKRCHISKVWGTYDGDMFGGYKHPLTYEYIEL